jgi:hypothetical protein
MQAVGIEPERLAFDGLDRFCDKYIPPRGEKSDPRRRTLGQTVG